MKLYFNGCSHTFGDDLKNPQTDSWPSIVANHYGFDFKNFSSSGSTNDRIKYQTIKHVDEFDKFYIAWTYTSRFTRYRADNNYIVNFNPRLRHQLYKNDADFVNYGNIHYRVWHNELYAFKLWLQDIILIQRYLESKNKFYVMLNADNNLIDRWCVGWPNFNSSVQSLICFDLMDDQQLQNEHSEIQSLLKQINFEHYIGWNTWWLTKMMSNYSVGPTGHLLEEGHLATAQHILKHDSNTNTFS